MMYKMMIMQAPFEVACYAGTVRYRISAFFLERTKRKNNDADADSEESYNQIINTTALSSGFRTNHPLRGAVLGGT